MLILTENASTDRQGLRRPDPGGQRPAHHQRGPATQPALRGRPRRRGRARRRRRRAGRRDRLPRREAPRCSSTTRCSTPRVDQEGQRRVRPHRPGLSTAARRRHADAHAGRPRRGSAGLSAAPPTVVPCGILHTSDWHLGRSFHREGMLGAPGGVRRPPARRRRARAGRPGGRRRRRLRPGAAATSTRSRLADEAFARLAASRARVVRHQRQPRLRPAARVRLPADRRRRRPHPHRRRARSARPVLLDDDHGPVAVYGLPYLDPDAAPRAVGAARPLPRGGAHRGDARGSAPTSPRRPGDPLGRAGPRVRRRLRSPATPSATSASAASRMVPTSVFDGVDYAALGHLHGRAHAHRPRPLQRLAAGLLLLRGRATQGLLAGRPRRRRRAPRAEFVEAPVPRPLARLRGDARRRCSPTPRSPATSTSWVQATLTDDTRPAAGDGPAARAASRTPCRSPSSPTDRPSRTPRRSRAPRGRSDHDIALDFVAELRGVPATDAESALLRRRLRRLLRRPRPRRPASTGGA